LGSHPVNLALRFVLEMTALAAMGEWGWHRAAGPWRYLLALALPVVAMSLWGVFAVPQDPSRSGNAPVPVPGAARLVLEAGFFGFATWALFSSGHRVAALVFGAVVLVHYALSFDRIAWLLKQQ
jgi:hypothetical protein